MWFPFLSCSSLPKSDSSSLIRHSCCLTGFACRSVSSGFVSSTRDQIYGHLLEICLKQCGKVKGRNLFDDMPQRLAQALRIGKAIHAKSIVHGFDLKSSLGNAIVDLYAKCRKVGSAEKAFGLLEKRDVTACNSMLSMYSRIGQAGQVSRSFASMLNLQVLPNDFTFSIVLSSCARETNIEFGKQIHCSMIKMGFESSSYCGGALVDMYAKCDFVGDARRIFNELEDPNTVSWTCMISGYVKAGLPEEAVKVFEKMRILGYSPDHLAFVTVINTYISLGKLDVACELFAEMRSPDVVAWNVMISGHAKRGYEVEAIEYFQNMRKSGVKSTRSTLGSVLSAAGNLGNLDSGLVVHADAIKLGLASNVYVGSSLVSMYSKCGKLKAGEKVFDALEEKNDVLWNSMLRGYAHNCNAHKVMELLMNMKCSGSNLDDFTFTSVLSACASLQDLEMGIQFHSVIIKKKFATNLFVGNALVDMYAKCGALSDARQHFERMSERDNVSWNAIIVGYVQEEDEIEAFNLFKRMSMCGMVPDEACIASILSACANIQGLHHGKQVHCLSIKCGSETGLYTGSSLIDMYAKCGVIENAHKVLFSMPEWSVVSMNALIAGYSQKNSEEAVALFQEMLARGLNPSEVTFASLLDACEEPQHQMLGTQIHGHIIKRGVSCDDEFLGISLLGFYMNLRRMAETCTLFSEFKSPKSTVLWTGIISGYSQNDFTEEALQFFKEMRCDGALPDQATFVSVLRACAVLSSLREGRAIHSLVFHTGYDLDELTSSALVDMYAKCGDVKSSSQVFGEMRCRDNVISWNSMIVGFAKNGYAEDALKLFNSMRQAHVMPDDVTFLGVLTACSHAGKVSEGREIFEMMINRYGIKPHKDHCACMVDLLGRWGYLQEAEDLVKRPKLEPDAKIWASLLGACRIHGDDIRGKMAAEKLVELEPDNSAAYVLLSNIYASQGRWEKVNALRRAMRDRGVKKSPGCSWIVVGQKTNVFVAGDKSHPDADKIEAFLTEFYELMKDDFFVGPDDVLDYASYGYA